jgi:hypothetical protein
LSAPITVLDLATFRIGRPASTGGDFAEAGLPLFGGCAVCGASVAAYNACPSRSGYLKCASGCIGEDGWDTVEEANRAIFETPEECAE